MNRFLWKEEFETKLKTLQSFDPIENQSHLGLCRSQKWFKMCGPFSGVHSLEMDLHVPASSWSNFDRRETQTTFSLVFANKFVVITDARHVGIPIFSRINRIIVFLRRNDGPPLSGCHIVIELRGLTVCDQYLEKTRKEVYRHSIRERIVSCFK